MRGALPERPRGASRAPSFLGSRSSISSCPSHYPEGLAGWQKRNADARRNAERQEPGRYRPKKKARSASRNRKPVPPREGLSPQGDGSDRSLPTSGEGCQIAGDPKGGDTVRGAIAGRNVWTSAHRSHRKVWTMTVEPPSKLGASRSRAETGSSARSKPPKRDRGRAEPRMPKGARARRGPIPTGNETDRSRYHGGFAVRRDRQTTAPVKRSEHTARRTCSRRSRNRGKETRPERPGGATAARREHRQVRRPCEPRTPQGDPPAEVPLRRTEIRLGSWTAT